MQKPLEFTDYVQDLTFRVIERSLQISQYQEKTDNDDELLNEIKNTISALIVTIAEELYQIMQYMASITNSEIVEKTNPLVN